MPGVAMVRPQGFGLRIWGRGRRIGWPLFVARTSDPAGGPTLPFLFPLLLV